MNGKLIAPLAVFLLVISAGALYAASIQQTGPEATKDPYGADYQGPPVYEEVPGTLGSRIPILDGADFSSSGQGTYSHEALKALELSEKLGFGVQFSLNDAGEYVLDCVFETPQEQEAYNERMLTPEGRAAYQPDPNAMADLLRAAREAGLDT